ncbi:enoyl-CoA-hydratase DpgD [Nocardiopsis listeri]|uniref:enoyl-CoA-hydratase DpgD n=1 Tax=Nocardiopsis listeri TaxID=53440 RepID=UPI000A0342AA|nr:enoyl-CoA-hydratase DpgD [Nocardiopsis listeri]
MPTRVDYAKRGRIAYVTINRPAVLNAMDLATHEELKEVWDDFESDDGLWLAVLTGAGDRAFSVGQDLKELDRRNREGAGAPSTFGSRGRPGWPRLTERFDMSKPVLARVNGYALGGGFELAMACDLVIAAEDAEFGLPEARLGLVPGAGGVFRLARQAPPRVALGHLMTGRRLTARRAYELGLVNEVVPAADLDACVDGWASDVLRCAPLAVRAVKEAAMASVDMPLERAFATRYVWEERRMHSEDALEGPRAFADKRDPRWQGR